MTLSHGESGSVTLDIFDVCGLCSDLMWVETARFFEPGDIVIPQRKYMWWHKPKKLNEAERLRISAPLYSCL
jgi:hypothetical protein